MLKDRVRTALILAPPVVAGIWLLPSLAVAGVAAAVFLLALWEWSRLVPMRAIGARCAYLGLALALMAAAWVVGPVELGPIAAGIGTMGWLLAFAWLIRIEAGRGGGELSAPLKALVGLLAVAVAWVLLTGLHLSAHGPAWFLLLLAVVWAADISAYFAGRRFGRRRLAPSISPGKTWAGAFGGLAGGAVTMLAGGFLLGFEPGRLAGLVVLGLATVSFSIVGDLFESLVKRQAGAKDSSALLPGHGGLFDRLDSLFAAVPVFSLGSAWVSA